MRKFIRNIIVFLFIYLSVGMCIRIFFTPYYWGNPWFGAKYQYIRSNNIPLNTVFIGSSRVYRQIIPLVFDSITQNKTKSFNLGAPATFCPQTYYLLDNLLNDTLFNIKYCFIELSEVADISDYLLHQERSNYWITPQYLKFTLSTIFDNPSFSKEKKKKMIKNYSISFIENMFYLGHFKEQLINNNYYNINYVGNNGFYSLEQELKETSDTIVKRSFINRRSIFLKDTNRLYERQQIISNFLTKNTIKDYSLTHLKKIEHYIKICNKKGVKIYFILLPRNITLSSYALFLKIPENHTINLADPNKFPELYNVNNSFDIGHLNNKGATILTTILANKFKQIESN